MNSGNLVGAVFGAILKVIMAVAVIYLIYRGAAVCYDYGYRIFMEPSMAEEGAGRTVTVTITEDMTPADIGALFEREGLVEDSTLFVMQYYLSEYRRDVKPGVFELNTSMTAEEMMEVMASSDTEDEAS